MKIRKNKVYYDINEESDYKGIEDYILDIYDNYKEIVIINIGTDKKIGDSFGPLLGTLLEEQKLDKFKTYGSLNNPIHALNIKSKLEKILKKHPDAYIIGTDACIGDESENMRSGTELFFRKERELTPGAGVGKKLPSVGTSSIVHIVESKGFSFFDDNHRLKDTYNAARQVCNMFVKIEKTIEDLEVTDEIFVLP